MPGRGLAPMDIGMIPRCCKTTKVNIILTCFFCIKNAGERTRTSTGLIPPGPKPGVSTIPPPRHNALY